MQNCFSGILTIKLKDQLFNKHGLQIYYLYEEGINKFKI